MKQTYKIEGMTCNGCRIGVENTLKSISGVTSVAVSLEKKEAVLETEKEIPLDDLKTTLPTKYTITKTNEINNAKAEDEIEEQDITPSKLQQLKPLFLIFGYITVASIGMHYKTWDWHAVMLDFMGLFYIIFSFFKLLDLRGFSESFRMYDPLAKVFPTYSWVYPFIEVVLGLLFLFRFQIYLALIATLIILGITTIGVTKTLLEKKAIQCACLGTALKLPMTEATFIENAIMIVMAITMLIQYL